MVQGPRPTRRPIFLAACALAYLVCVVFWPLPGFEFVESDVVGQVVYNPYIRGLTAENLKHILTSRCITSYYPVRTLTYAVDYQIWGLNAAGFKLTGGLLHLANVFLVFWLILRLLRHGASAGRSPEAWWDVSVATLTAGIFAVHPVVVEPVTWVAGREELLMTLGALGCIHFHLSARRLGQDESNRRWAVACHAAAAFCCAAACLSSAVAAVIPLLIVAWDVLMLPRPKAWKIVYGTAPLWAIGVLTVLIKGPGGDAVLAREAGALSAQRLMLVLNVYWLNLKTLAWPADLSLSYGRVKPESFLDGGVMLGGIAVCLTCLVLWKLRSRKLIVFGMLWYGLALGPTSQIMPHHIHRADRYLYLPLVGLAVAVSAGLRPLGKAMKSRPAVAGAMTIGVSCLLVLDVLSTYQVRAWRDSVSLWEHCAGAAPDNPVCHRALADSLAKRGRLDRAIPHYQTALWLEPAYIDALRNFAFYMVTCGEELRDDDLAIGLAERGCELTQWMDPDLLRTLAMAYARARRFEEAVAAGERALQLAQAAGNAELVAELRRQLNLGADGE